MLSVLLFKNSRRNISSYIHQISLTYQIHVPPFKMRGVFPFCHNYLKTSNTSKSTSKRKETILSKLAEETNTIYMMLWFTKKDVAISYLTDQYIRLITTPSLPEWQEFLPEKIMILKKLGRRGGGCSPPAPPFHTPMLILSRNGRNRSEKLYCLVIVYIVFYIRHERLYDLSYPWQQLLHKLLIVSLDCVQNICRQIQQRFNFPQADI